MTTQDLQALSKQLDCRRVRDLKDDVYNYDTMVGFDCYDESDGWTTVRVYDSPASVGQVLSQWSTPSERDSRILAGRNWFALGDESSLRRIADLLTLDRSQSEIPASLPLTRRQEGIRTCSVATVTLARDAVAEQSDDELARSYEQVFPGIGNLAAGIAVKLDEERVKAEDDFEYAITAHGHEIKSFCAGVVGNGS